LATWVFLAELELLKRMIFHPFLISTSGFLAIFSPYIISKTSLAGRDWAWQ
jgi:hypothetical protein